jgi:ABC-2 type transport system ATP-binding protein
MAFVLQVASAHKSFGSTKALDGVGLELAPGEWLALLGPNGAGKTTLIRAIAGRVRLDAGEIRVFGAAVTSGAGGAGRSSAAEARKRIGIVPQELALYPRLTARENLEIFGRLQGLGGARLRERALWGLEFTGLADRANDPIKSFSGGMKRRLNIACGVLHKPDLVLLDEPTVGVDPQSRQRIVEMLAELRRNGASLLLTTHQLDEVPQICDRIVIIDHGKVIAAGTLDELVAQTIGRQRHVTLHLDRPAPAALVGGAAVMNGTVLRLRVENVAAELPELLTRLQSAGCRVDDITVAAPSLHEVFIHLTGRELRE